MTAKVIEVKTNHLRIVVNAVNTVKMTVLRCTITVSIVKASTIVSIFVATTVNRNETLKSSYQTVYCLHYNFQLRNIYVNVCSALKLEILCA